MTPTDEAADPTATDETIPPGAVVVGVDGSAPAEAALRWAATEASRRGLPLHIIAAQEQMAAMISIDTPLTWVGTELAAFGDCEQQRAWALPIVAEVAPDLAPTMACPLGRAAGHLVEASDQASVVVVGNRGLGRLSATMMGTVSLQTATHARCPVVVLREGFAPAPTDRPRRAVVGFDGSDDSRAAIRFALDHVGPDGSVTIIVAWWLEVVDGVVVTTPDSPQWHHVTSRLQGKIDDAVREALGEAGDPRVRGEVVRGHAAQVLINASADADLLVVGTRGRGGFAGLLLGSVSQQVLTAGPCPIAVLSHRPSR